MTFAGTTSLKPPVQAALDAMAAEGMPELAAWKRQPNEHANGSAEETNGWAHIDAPPPHPGTNDGPHPGPGEPDPPPKERRLQFANFADMGFDGALLTLVKGLVGDLQTVVLFGDSGSGKSLIALSMAMSIALGVPILWPEDQTGLRCLPVARRRHLDRPPCSCLGEASQRRIAPHPYPRSAIQHRPLSRRRGPG